MRTSTAIRTAAWAVVAAGILAPLVRRRVAMPKSAVLAAAAAAPAALSVAARRTPLRDVAVCVLQMWAYTAAYELPNSDPERLAQRVHVDYPVRIDRLLGLGTQPTLRLQRLSSHAAVSRFEALLVWCHWIWFFVPHATVAYIHWRRPEQFERAVATTYAVFDLGAVFYWVVPTAPPWYAAQLGRFEVETKPAVRRMMIEYGQQFWRRSWTPLYTLLAGNPLAAMPSLHFATSWSAARLLADAGPVPGALGFGYALTLGLALVYLGEHYLIDLIAGAALAEGVRRGGPRVAPLLRRFTGALVRLEARAHA